MRLDTEMKEWILDGHKITIQVYPDYASIYTVHCPKDPRGRCRILRRMTEDEAEEYRKVIRAHEDDPAWEMAVLSDGREVVEGELTIPRPDEARVEGDCWVEQELKNYHFEIFDVSIPIIVSGEMEIAWRQEDADVYVTFAIDPAVAFKKMEGESGEGKWDGD